MVLLFRQALQATSIYVEELLLPLLAELTTRAQEELSINAFKAIKSGGIRPR